MDILLVHGLGRTPYSMKALGKFLQQYDHTPHYFGYAAYKDMKSEKNVVTTGLEIDAIRTRMAEKRCFDR